MDVSKSYGKLWMLGYVGSEHARIATRALYAEGRCQIPALYVSPGSYGVAVAYTALLRDWNREDRWNLSFDYASFAGDSGLVKAPQFVSARPEGLTHDAGAVAALLLQAVKTAIAVEHGERSKASHSVAIVHLRSNSDIIDRFVLKMHAPVLVPVAASVAATAMCVLHGDCAGSVVILVGMVVGGYTSLCLQAGDLTFDRTTISTAAGSARRGDGYFDDGKDLVVLKGAAGAVEVVTGGRFVVRFKTDPSLGSFTIAAVLLTGQTILQVLLVPFCTSRGQLAFLFATCASWIFNAYITWRASLAWRMVVLEDLLKKPAVERHVFGSRTMAVVFLMQVLDVANVEERLAALVPNDGPAWSAWRKIVAYKLRGNDLEAATFRRERCRGLCVEDMALLDALVVDADGAFKSFRSA